ncbi:unnamed protein product [Rotaria socialis]
MPHISSIQQTVGCSLSKVDTYADAMLRTLYSFKTPPPPMPLHARRQYRRSYPQSATVSQSVVNELVNGTSDNQQSIADPSSLSSSTSSLFSSSSSPSLANTGDNYFTLEARLPLVKNKVEQLEKFKRLLLRLDSVYNSNSNNNNNNNNNSQAMSTTTLPPPSSHISDRYLFGSPSNDNRASRMSATTRATRKTKSNHQNPVSSSSTPPLTRKRYKFSSAAIDQNNNNVYKFPNEHIEPRSHSTDSDRYYFSTDDSLKQPQKTLTYIRSGNGLEPHTITFIDGTSSIAEKISLPTTIVTDTPYLFSKTSESQAHPSITSPVSQQDSWIEQRQQPHIVFDSITDLPPNAQLKRSRTSSTSPEHRHPTKRSPTRMDTITSTNGSLSTLRRSPPNKVQNVRFDPSTTSRSYLDEARERLAGRKRGRSPQAFQQSVDRLVSSTNQKYLHQQIFSPPISSQHKPYVSQYYAQEEPPIDYPIDSDEDEPQQKRSPFYSRGLNTNRTHTQIMKNVNKSLIDGNYLSDANRIKQLDQNFNRYLRSLENQSLQRELNHDLIRCFSSTYLDDLRREENRNIQTRSNMRSYTYEDVQDIHMSPALESFKMKRAIDRERRLRLSTSFDGQITSSTPTSSLGAGILSPLLSTYSPIMTGSLNENIDAQSGGFDTDRRSQKSHTSTAQTPTNGRPSFSTPGPNLDMFYEIMHDRFRGVDATIAGQVSNASQYAKNKGHQQPPPPPTTTSQMNPADNDSDVDIKSNSSFWSDEEEEQQQQTIDDNQRKTIPNQRQLSRYLSTVNRSLLDRPSDLIADFYISQLNHSMKESVRHVETIARDKALMRQDRNREFIEETTSKLGRSLSAEHLYQVRKEHLRYKQPVTTPTSFTVEDVADIYKPFVLENYKRKIAIEVERRRREKQGQLMAGSSTPSMYASDTDFSSVVRSTQPPIIEAPLIPVVDRGDRTLNLTRTSILRTNEPGAQTIANDPRNELIIVRPPVVQTKKIRTGRARRIVTDDGSADVVHHVGIVSPPPSYSALEPVSAPRVPIKIERYDTAHITTMAPPDFVDRTEIYIRKERAHSNIVQPTPDGLVDRALATSQQVLFRNADYNTSLQIATQIVTSQTQIISPPRSPAKIYTPAATNKGIRVCHADRVETASGNHDLSMANIKPILTLNQGEITELNLLADHAQRLQIPSRDYDHAMVIITPEQTQDQHTIDPRPVLLAAASINRLSDQPNEQVTRHIHEEIERQQTQLVTPVPEHMAKVEQDIAIFENISAANIHQYTRNKLNEMLTDSGIVSLNTSQGSEQPLILNASRMSRLDPSDEEHLENLIGDDYYQRCIRAYDLLRHVEIDPNTNIQPVRSDQINIFENTINIPSSNLKTEHTYVIEHDPIETIQSLQHTDEPVIYETVEETRVNRTPGREYLTSTNIDFDNQVTNRPTENTLKWGKPVPVKTYPPADIPREPLPSVPTLNYGEANMISLSRTSSFGSDNALKQQSQDAAKVTYNRHDTSSLDKITRPLYQHPPILTHHEQQQQTSVDIDEEPMAVHLETSWITDVSYGRASFIGPIQPLSAPKELIEPNRQALLLEELATATTAVNEQHATQVIESNDHQNRFEKIEQANRVPTIIYDTDWKNEETKFLSNETKPDLQLAKENLLPNIEYQQARITKPRPILSREHYEYIDNDPQEVAIQTDVKSLPHAHSNEQAELNNQTNFKSPPTEHSIANQLILCRPIINHLELDDEQPSSLSHDSLLAQQPQKPNINLNEPNHLENPIHSTSILTLNYAQHSQEVNPPWQRVFDNELSDEYQHLQQNLQVQTEKSSQLSDGSLLIRHEPILPENPLRSTAFLTLNYAQDNQEHSSAWEQISDQQFSNQHLQQQVQILPELLSPRHLPLITSEADERTLKESDNFVGEFQQVPLLHENVRIETSDKIPLVSSTNIDQTKPVYCVQQQQLSPTHEYDYAQILTIQSNNIDRIHTTHADSKINEPTQFEQRPVTIDIEVRVRPAHSDTSSIVDMDSFLNRFEESLEPEQHLPLVDQVSLSYATSIRSTSDGTQRAIERYEKKHPFFSRALPTEWINPRMLPHDEQLVEQWTVEKNIETIQQQVELNTNNKCSGVAAAIANYAYSIDERFEDETSQSITTKTTDDESDNNHIAAGLIVSHCSPTSDYETDSLDKDIDTTSTTTSIGTNRIYTATPITPNLPSQSTGTVQIVPVDYLLDTLADEKRTQTNPAKDFLLTIGFDQAENNHNAYIHRAKENELEHDDNLLLYNFDENEQELLNTFFEPAHFYLPTVNEISIYQISFHTQYSSISAPDFLEPTIHDDDDRLSSNQCRTTEQEILLCAKINHQNDYEDEQLKSLSYKYEQPSYIEHYHIQPLNPLSETFDIKIDEPPTIIENDDDHSTTSLLPDVILSTTTIHNEAYIPHDSKEVKILPTHPTIESTPLPPSLDSRVRARQTTQPDDAEQLSEQHYVVINQATPTPSMRKVRPSRPGPAIQQPIMIDSTEYQTTRIPFNNEPNELHYAASRSRDQTDHLPPARLPTEQKPDVERARLVPSSTSPIKDLGGDVLIRETIVQHVSEDEKSTSSEEVVFEEWSEEFRCRRTEEFDKNTNRLLSRRIDPIGARVKSDVIKEEYKEKNERIKGHKSYDIVKEVFRRVPAHSVDPNQTPIVSIERPESPVYEEISQPPHSIRSSISPDCQVITEITPRNRHWSSEDIYTTEIVYDSQLARDIECIANAERFDRKFDTTTSPSTSSANYDRVRPGQYTTIPSTSQVTISREQPSTYDRISNIITPSVHVADRRQQQNEEFVSEEYHVELEQKNSDDSSSSGQNQRFAINTQQQQQRQQRGLFEDDMSDAYVTTGDRTYQGLTTIVDQAGQRRDSDWRSKMKQIYAPTSDDDQFDQLGKPINDNYTAQRVIIEPTNIQQTFQDTQINKSGHDKILSEENKLTAAPPSRHAVKEILVRVTRGPSPDKHLRQQIYHLSSTSDEDEQENKRLVFADSLRARETSKKFISTSRTDEGRPKPPKRSSSSSIIDERRARFEQPQFDTSNDSTNNKIDRTGYGRVGALRNAFETTTVTSGSIRDDQSKPKSPITTGLTEQRRRIFEEQEQANKGWTSTNRRSQQVTSTTVVPQRRIYRISGRQPTHIIDEFDTHERRMSETHTAPSRVTERISHIQSNESKPADRLSRTGYETIKSSFESSTTKSTEQLQVPPISTDSPAKDKRIISSIDSDVSGASPPIYQSTPKSVKQKQDEDAGHESEDELSDPANQQEQQYDIRRRTPKTRLRDFSQSTSQQMDDTAYLSQRNKSSFTESNMENILSHVPTSKGKGLLIELSPHLSQEIPVTSTTMKPSRDPHKGLMGSDSGIFEYSTATSQRLPASSSSWRNNVSSSMNDDVNRTPTTRDSGIYGDSVTTTLSSRYGRRQASDTDQTTIHGGDDSVSRSIYRYDTEIISPDQYNQLKQQPQPQQQQQQQQPLQPARAIRRQITATPPSDYENIANYHSGISSQRKVPITTQSRTILTRPLIVDEIETIETETRVECQVQRTHEIKESTTTTERSGSPSAPKKVTTTTTTTTTTTAAPPIRSPETSSDEASRVVTPAKRFLLNDRTHYYESAKANASPIPIRSPLESTYTPTNEIRQQIQTFRDNNFQQHRYDSPQSDTISYQLPSTATTTTTKKTVIREEPIRVEETWFKPIQRDRSQDSLLQSSTSRSNVRTLSAGPRNMEITSLSPQNQVTFGKYTPNEIIAIVRVPELSNGNSMRPSPIASTIRHGISEPELNARVKQQQQEEEENQLAKLQYERIYSSNYRPSTIINQDYQQRQSRSRTSPSETANGYSSSIGPHARSSSYHSVLHEQDRQQQQEQDQYGYPSSSKSAYRRQIKRRTGSLGNLLGPSIEFEIEIEKRPPQSPEQPTVVALDQASRAIVTTSKDGRVSIQNIAARPGNTVVINSDFHSSDRSLNRSSGYFSADELRSQGINPNYSSDEQSSGTGLNMNVNSRSSNTPSSHARRYRNNDQVASRLPSHYRTKQSSNYQPLNNDSFDKLNQIVHRHYRQSNTNNNNTSGFSDTIDQIDALYNNLDVQTNENSNSPTTYDFSKSTSNRRRNVTNNTNDYQTRYTSTGFPHVSNHETATPNSTLRHFVSPPNNDTHRAYSDNENLNANTEHNRNWGSTSLNDLIMSTPIRPSQSLSSSGILADYATPGSISPNSGYGSTQNVVLQQNRLNSQGQVLQRNRTSVKQVKQKSAAKKKTGNIQGQYSDEEEDNDSAGGHDSPLSDNYRPQPPTRFANRYQ